LAVVDLLITVGGLRKLTVAQTICCKYRVIHKSLRDFRPQRYSSRDGHAEGEHINRGRDTPNFCPTLQVLDMCTLGDAADVNPVIKFLQHALQRMTIPATVPHGSEIPEGLMNNPVC
jgi:hypothetical protein